MVDYTVTKSFGTKVYPVEANETTNLFGRCEPIVTPEQLISRHLKGIDLSDFSNDELKDQIELAINDVELMSNLNIYKVSHKERIPYDRNLYKAFVYTKTNHKPILSVENMAVVSSNGEHIFTLPATWLEMGLAWKGQINLIPILTIFGGTNLSENQASNAGLIFLRAVNNFSFIPAFWTIEYTAGISHTEGQVPKNLNTIIGITAAIEILGIEQTKIKYNSTSISQDGLSQSASGKGPETYQPRIDALEARRTRLLEKTKSRFMNKYFLTNI